MAIISSCIILFEKDYRRTMASGWVARGTVFQEIRPWAGFKTGDFVIEKLGGLPKNDSKQALFFPPSPLLRPARVPSSCLSREIHSHFFFPPRRLASSYPYLPLVLRN